MDMLRGLPGSDRPHCLCHQTIGVCPDRARKVMHGKTDLIHHDGKSFRWTAGSFEDAHYSLAIERDLPIVPRSLPK